MTMTIIFMKTKRSKGPLPNMHNLEIFGKNILDVIYANVFKLYYIHIFFHPPGKTNIEPAVILPI